MVRCHVGRRGDGRFAFDFDIVARGEVVDQCVILASLIDELPSVFLTAAERKVCSRGSEQVDRCCECGGDFHDGD